MTKESRLDQYECTAQGAADLNELAQCIRSWAVSKGFEEDVDKLFELVQDDPKLADFLFTLFSIAQVGLIVSELGELVEQLRKPSNDDHVEQYTGQTAETADTIIRLLHLQARHDVGDPSQDLAKCLRDKMIYNETRPYKHGKKA